jgi:phenylacetate-coenzyme A ligase PaaK-like adenylate-forming protein
LINVNSERADNASSDRRIGFKMHVMAGIPASPASAVPRAAFEPWRAGAAAASVIAGGCANEPGLATLRRRRLSELLRAARRAPLYRAAIERAGDDAPLEALPVLRRRELMARFDESVTDSAVRLRELRRFLDDPAAIGRPYQGRFAAWESSGSTGEPGVFVNDASSLAVQDALEAWRRPSPRPAARLMDPLYLGERIAFVGATGGHFASIASLERLRRLNPLLAPRLRCLSFLLPLPELDEQLDAWRPTILSTYPSMAVILAEERRAGRLRGSPAEVWTGGEALTPAMRAFVRESFECPVTNDYGCSEFLALAAECPRGRLHLNADWALLESIDAAGRPVPTGQPGARCLLTSLANHLQPLIRYELGDRVTLHDEPCGCGSRMPVIEVCGRSDDLLRVGDAARAVALSPLALSTVLEDDAGLFDFQLVQRGPHRLELTTRLAGREARRGLDRGRDALQAFLREQGAGPVSVQCRCAEPIRQQRSGKIKRVLVAPA